MDEYSSLGRLNSDTDSPLSAAFNVLCQIQLKRRVMHKLSITRDVLQQLEEE